MTISPFLRQLVLVTAILGNFAFSADNPVKEMHELTGQWTGLEHQKDLLQANWRKDKPVLEQQLALLERETRELTAVVDASAQEKGEVEQKRLELLEEQTRLEQEQAALERSLQQTSNRMHALHPQLPPPLFDAWQEDLLRLDDVLLTSSEKLQVALQLLGELDDFQQKITLNEALMTLADGQEYLVKQVYLGLSHGWYVSADQKFAASGTATIDGWQWTAVTDSAPISQIIGIVERRQSPVLVSIPLQLKAPPAGGN